MPRRITRAGLLGLTMTVIACSTSPGVRTDGAAQHVEDTVPPTTNRPGPVSTVDWTSCPDPDPELTLAWECAWVDVPLDHDDPSGEQITVALTRPELDAGDDRRPLVLEPGGPGASGIELAWYLVDVLPGELLDHFYPVGWDPRGVGRSQPPVDCGPLGAFEVPAAADCIAGTGPLLAEVGAADAALDLEQVRLALGVDRLDYLGYSYGTALGSVYAMNYPDGVGRFVLDGAIDPTSGDPRGPLSSDGVPDYAADELDDVIDRFHELCDASDLCAAGPDSAALVDDLGATIRDLPTADFSGDPAQMSRVDLDDLMIGITYDPWSWGLVGDALRDGAEGDASTLAALSSYLLDGYPSGEVDEDALTEFGAAHFAIYCADFSNVPDAWGCEGMPAADPLPVIATVDVAEPIVVIGTSDDPSTPGRHAAELAAALGDAVSITWQGVGHTAFPVSECLDGLVVDYLVDGVVPADGASCPFVDDLVTDAEIGDYLFDYPEYWVRPWLEEVFVAEGSPDEEAACLAGELAGSPHRVVTHLLLGVRSTEAVAARGTAEAAC
ncbi:MAG: alpha/beta fold hydrolase [Ilumatobacteraceae bacterium]